MRIGYIFPEKVSRASGVLKKLLAQVKTWQSNGHEVKVFCISPAGDVWERLRDIPVEVFFWKRLWSLFRTHREMADGVTAWRPDVLYLRYALYAPALVTLAHRYPLLVEINSNDVAERMKGTPWWMYAYNRITRHLVLESARGLVFVAGGDLPASRHFARFKKPTLILANGIDLSLYPVLPPPGNDRPRLVFMGTPRQPWHGVDKILYLASQCLDWSFQLIGLADEAMPAPVPPNVTSFVYLDQPDYERVLCSADVALGTLALHRKMMNEASPLKVREYLAYGLPTIIGYKDTDFPAESPFLLQLPNTEDNVSAHLSQLRSFVERVKGTRVRRDQIVHLDVAHKEPQRLEFLERFTVGFTRRQLSGLRPQR